MPELTGVLLILLSRGLYSVVDRIDMINVHHFLNCVDPVPDVVGNVMFLGAPFFFFI